MADFLPELVKIAQAKAAANSPQWKAFLARLELWKGRITGDDYPAAGGHSYQGGFLSMAMDYALAYRALVAAAPDRAAEYAEKAVGVIRAGLYGYQRLYGSGSRRFVAVGDGRTTTFTVPDEKFVRSTLRVFKVPVADSSVTRGTGPSDQLGGTPNVIALRKILAVGNSAGASDYAETTDWLDGQTSGLDEDLIDWSPGGKQPADGATYWIRWANLAGSPGGYPLSKGVAVTGATVKIAPAPTEAEAVFMSYVYTDADGLRFQQSCNVPQQGRANWAVDSSYTSRNLANLWIAAILLWEWDRFPAAVKEDLLALGKEWGDKFYAQGYAHLSPGSNYYAGHFLFWSAAALLADGRDAASAAPMKAGVLGEYAARQAKIFADPPMTNEQGTVAGTHKGGTWAEGWQYGPLAVRNCVVAIEALAAAGWLSGAAVETWCDELCVGLCHQWHNGAAAPHVWDGGDADYPTAWPGWRVLLPAQYWARDPRARAYASWLVQNLPAGTAAKDDAWELCLRDPSAPATDPRTAGLPGARHFSGMGLVIGRSDWNDASTWYWAHAGNVPPTGGHQENAQGILVIWRGPDDLLPNLGQATQFKDAQKSRYMSGILVDDGGAGHMTYPGPDTPENPRQGGWYTNDATSPGGCRTLRFETDAGYTYSQGDYRPAWGKNYDGVDNPLTEGIRCVFHDRTTDCFFVYDRVTSLEPPYRKQLQWYFYTGKLNGSAATITTDPANHAWDVVKGASRLFGRTYSTRALTSTWGPEEKVNRATARRFFSNTAAPDDPAIRYVSVLQVTAAIVPSMAPSAHVVAGDSKVEGALLGKCCVMFGRAGPVAGPTSYPVTAARGESIRHFVTDLTPGTRYALTGADQAGARASPAGVLAFTATGTGSAQTLSVSPM